jgi:hypothetical protein
MKRKASGKQKKTNSMLFSFTSKIELEDIVTPPNEDKQLPVSVSDEYYGLL